MCLKSEEPSNGLWYSCTEECGYCQEVIGSLVEIEYELAKGLFGSHGIYFTVSDEYGSTLIPQLATFTDKVLLTCWHSKTNGRSHWLPEISSTTKLFVTKKVYDAAMHRLQKYGRVGYTANM